MRQVARRRRRSGFITEIDSIEYSVTTDRADFDAIFRFRYKILVSIEGYFPKNASERVFDKFDFTPNSTHLQAHFDGSLIGSLRLVMNSSDHMPSDSYFDVRGILSHVPQERMADLSRIVVDREFRKHEVGCNLMKLGHSLGIADGVTHFVGIANPRAMTFFCGKLGWHPVDEQKFDFVHGVPYIPIVGEASVIPTLEIGRRSEPLHRKQVSLPMRDAL